MIEIQDLADLQASRKGARLELGSHDRVKILAILLGVESHDADSAPIGDAKSDHALDGGGLPRPVRTQDAEDLAFLNRERHVINRHRGPVRLAEMQDLDSGLGVGN